MHTDRVLSGRVKLCEEELEQTLDELLQLFLFISDKDLYAELYREQLARKAEPLGKRGVSPPKSFSAPTIYNIRGSNDTLAR